MEINVHDLKEAIEEAKTIILESNKEWMTIREQTIAEVTIKNFLIELSEILAIND